MLFIPNLRRNTSHNRSQVAHVGTVHVIILLAMSTSLHAMIHAHYFVSVVTGRWNVTPRVQQLINLPTITKKAQLDNAVGRQGAEAGEGEENRPHKSFDENPDSVPCQEIFIHTTDVGSDKGTEPTIVKFDDQRDRQKSTEADTTIKFPASLGTKPQATFRAKTDTSAWGNVLPLQLFKVIHSNNI